MWSGAKPSRTRLRATERRALSKPSVELPSESSWSPATTTAAQPAKGFAAAGGAAAYAGMNAKARKSATTGARRLAIFAPARPGLGKGRDLRQIGEVLRGPLEARRLEQRLQVALGVAGVIGLVQEARKRLDQSVEFRQVAKLDRVAHDEDAAGLQDARDLRGNRRADL